MNTWSKSIRLLAYLLAAAILVPAAAFATATGPSSTPTISDGPLVPESHYSDISMLVRDVISRLHYSPPEFDNDLSSRTFDRYIALLDPSRSYFLAADIAEFEQYRNRMVQRRRASDLTPAYAIYNRFYQRLGERTAYLLGQLGAEPDFAVEEEYRFDRTEAPWAASVDELNEVTRQRFKNDALTLHLTGQEWPQVMETLERRYKGIERRAGQTVSNDVFQAFMNALTTSIDPHTAYLTPRAQENFRIDMSLSLEGIGAVLVAEDDYTRIVSVVPAGPADQSKALFPNDRVLGVAQGDDGAFVDVVGWRIDDVVQLIRGPRNTVVRLLVLSANASPDASPQVVRLERKQVRLEEQAAKRSIIEVERDGRMQRIGVIELPTFYADFAALQAGDPDAKSTTRDVSRLLTELKAEGVEGVVIDLRGNGGGSLSEATDLAALFLGDGPVVQIRTGDGATQVSRNSGVPALYTGPLAVLIDRRSASGSEIFAGVIQDYGRGVIIGDRTFGKGTVQQLIPLDRFSRGNGPRLGELKLTIAKFYRVSGGSNQHRGILPDIDLPTPYGENGFGESERPTALPWDEIAATPFSTGGEIPRVLGELQERHEHRAASDDALALLEREYATMAAARSRTTVSLNRGQRVRENQQLEQQRLDLENARRALRGLEPLASLESMGATEQGEDVLLAATAEVVADLAEMIRQSGIVRASRR